MRFASYLTPAARLISLALILGGCGLALGGCSEPAAPGSFVELDSAGVRVVVSEKTDLPLSWRFEYAFSVLHPEGGLEGFANLYPGALGVDAQGNLFVLDRASARLFSFDSVGGLRWAVGGIGDGPGEFRSPFSVAVSESGDVAVHDGRRGVLIEFDAGGRFVDETPFNYAVTDMRTPVLQRVHGGAYVLRRELYTGLDEREVSLLWAANGDTATVLTTQWLGSKTVHFPDCGVSLALPPVFTPAFRWAASSNDLLLVLDHEYRVDRVRGGRVVQSIRRGIDPVATTREDALQRLGDGVESPAGSCLRSSEGYVRHYGYHPWHQLVRDVAVSPAGKVWVRRYQGADAEDLIIDVFDAGGVYMGTLPAETPFPALFITEERFLALERDEWDMYQARVWGFTAE